MIPTDRYCHSGPSNGDNSILTKLSVMPFCHGGGGRNSRIHFHVYIVLLLLSRHPPFPWNQVAISYYWVTKGSSWHDLDQHWIGGEGCFFP